MKVCAVTAVCMLVAVVHAQQICKKDSDCDALGKLECIKSMCDWGICSCERGKVAMFAGSDKKFACVPLRRIGDTCSETTLVGLCGAPNSYCRDGFCKCDDRDERLKYEAYWGGELCVLQDAPSKYSGEAYSADGIGECVNGTEATTNMDWSGPFDNLPEPYASLTNSPLDGVPNVCACAEGYHTAIPEVYGASDFVGGKYPSCVKNEVGNLCLTNTDCNKIFHWNSTMETWQEGSAVCVSEKCECASGTVRDITGLYCGVAMKKGDLCYELAAGVGGNETKVPPGMVCKGGDGLRCGDPCSLVPVTNLTCVCDPLTTDERGGKCKQKEGNSCTSTSQCSGVSGSKCIGGQCSVVNSAPLRVPTTLIVAMVSLVVAKCGHTGST